MYVFFSLSINLSIDKYARAPIPEGISAAL
jgi:hypothetical protein